MVLWTGGKCSTPFDFECACVIDDGIADNKFDLSLKKVLARMFEGVLPFQELICLPKKTIADFCGEIRREFYRVIALIPPKTGDTPKSGRLREFYAVLFEARGILPGEISRQDPAQMFFLLSELSKKNEQKEFTPDMEGEIPPYLRDFYGL